MFRFNALVALSLLIAGPAIAANPNQTVFAADGEHFAYTTALGHGAIRIDGQVVESGERFSLLVDERGQVSGTFGATPVDFTVSRLTRDRMYAELQGKDATLLSEGSMH